MKKEEKTKLTKERILTAAIEEFSGKGYSYASLNNICSCGIPKGLLYHNFENKDALYLACMKQCFTSFTAYLTEHSPGPSLHRYMNARLHFFQENEALAKLFFEAILHPPVHLKEQVKELKKEFDELNLVLYKSIIASISLREGVTEKNALEYFDLMQNMFNGYFSSPAYQSMAFHDMMDEHEKNLSRILDFMLYGIAERRCRE